jgi:hypothetical protein
MSKNMGKLVCDSFIDFSKQNNLMKHKEMRDTVRKTQILMGTEIETDFYFLSTEEN